jgi:hypothetical protein
VRNNKPTARAHLLAISQPKPKPVAPAEFNCPSINCAS